MSGKRGRPTTFDQAIAGEICRRVADGESLRSVCRDDHVPSESTVRGWHIENIQGFSAQFARARELQLECWAEEIVEIADDGSNDWIERARKDGSIETVLDREHVSRSVLRVDTRKWLLSKLAPKKYGDRIQVDANVKKDARDYSDDELIAIASRGRDAGEAPSPPERSKLH